MSVNKKVNTFTGMVILIWFIVSPILGLTLYFKFFEYFEPISAIIFIITTYITLGLFGYFIAKKLVGKDKNLFQEIKVNKSGKWTTVLNYTVGTNIIFFVVFQVVMLIVNLTQMNINWFIYILLFPAITWLAAKYSLQRTKKLFNVDKKIKNNSIIIFIGLNLIGAIFIKIIQNQSFLSVNDIGLILCFVTFYLYTKRMIKDSDIVDIDANKIQAKVERIEKEIE